MLVISACLPLLLSFHITYMQTPEVREKKISLMKAVIDDTITYYTADPKSRRSVTYCSSGESIGCSYLHPTGKMCAVGRLMHPDMRSMIGNSAFNSGGFPNILERDEVIEKYIELGQFFENKDYDELTFSFFCELQRLHDADEYWTDIGLSQRGVAALDYLQRTIMHHVEDKTIMQVLRNTSTWRHVERMKEEGEEVSFIKKMGNGMLMIGMNNPENHSKELEVKPERGIILIKFDNGWTAEVDYNKLDPVHEASQRRFVEELTLKVGWFIDYEGDPPRTTWNDGDGNDDERYLNIMCGPMDKFGDMSELCDVYGDLEKLIGEYAEVGASENYHVIKRSKLEEKLGRPMELKEVVEYLTRVFEEAGVSDENDSTIVGGDSEDED